MAGVTNDDVVEDFNLEKLTSADEVAGNLDVGFARRGFSARVVVGQEESGGGGHNGEAEYLERVNQERVVGAYADEVMGFDAAAGVEEEDGKAFAFGVEGFGVGNVQAPIGGGGFWGVAKGHLVGGPGLAEGDDLVNVGRGSEAEGLDDLVQTRQRRLEGCALLLIRTALEP